MLAVVFMLCATWVVTTLATSARTRLEWIPAGRQPAPIWRWITIGTHSLGGSVLGALLFALLFSPAAIPLGLLGGLYLGGHGGIEAWASYVAEQMRSGTVRGR
jgi:ABC-type phosphate transport system permease subunit